MDRALLCEQQARDANLRAEKVSTPRFTWSTTVTASHLWIIWATLRKKTPRVWIPKCVENII
jgi:hypothetical protein